MCKKDVDLEWGSARESVICPHLDEALARIGGGVAKMSRQGSDFLYVHEDPTRAQSPGKLCFIKQTTLLGRIASFAGEIVATESHG